MPISDPIADMLTRIRNAGKAKFRKMDVPASRVKKELAQVLKNEGFIKDYKFIKDSKQGILRLYLKYDQNRESVILNLKRISKPSRRVYVKCKDIKPLLNGMGISILSTSKGIKTDQQAKKDNVGGEFLCNVW